MDRKAVIRRVFDLIDKGKLADAGKLFAPNAYWLFPGRNALSGEYLGREAIVEDLLPKLSALSGSTDRATLLDLSESELGGFALQSFEANRNLQSLSTTVCHSLVFGDGLIQGVYSYPFDAAAVDASWALDAIALREGEPQ